jgi:hypothetical protein
MCAIDFDRAIDPPDFRDACLTCDGGRLVVRDEYGERERCADCDGTGDAEPRQTREDREDAAYGDGI